MTPILDLVETLPTTLPFGIDLLLRATIILGLAQLVSRALRRRSAATRHFVVTLGLAAVIALPLFMLALPDARLEVLPAATEAQPNTIATPVANESLGTWKSGDGTAEAISSGDIAEVTRAIATTGIADRRAITVATIILWVGDNWQGFLLAGLTLIPGLLFGRMLMGMIAVWMVARRAEPVDDEWMQSELARASARLSVRRPISMLLSDRINVPLVWGFVSPVLILPTSASAWTPERLRVVILHEVAHVKRFDVLSLLTGRFATALYWFHPLSWALEATSRRESERACDDLVLQSGARASDYADHLLGIAAGEDLAESYASVTLAMARPSELEGRLVSILRAEGERTPVSRRVATFTAVAAFVMLLPIATIRLTAKSVDLPRVDVNIAQTDASTDQVAVAVIEPSSDSGTVEIHALDENEAVVLAQLKPSDYIVEVKGEDDVVQVGNRHKKKEYSSDGEKWYAEAYEFHGQDRYDEAIAAFKKAIENDFNVGTSMYNIGCGYAMKGDVDNAVRWIDDAFKNGFTRVSTVEKDSDLDPIRSDARFRGLLRDLQARFGSGGHKDRFEVAKGQFEELRATNSDNAGKWSKVGLALLQLRELDDAIYSLDRAISLKPDSSSTAYYNLSCAYALKGDSRRALQALEKSILNGFDGGNKMSNDPDLSSIRGEKRFAELRVMNDDLSLWSGIKKEKKHDEKMKWDENAAFRKELPRFEAVTAKYPDSGRAWFNLGYASLRVHNTDRARAAFERSLSLEYKRATSMYNLACVEAIAGNREAAINWLYESEKAGGSLGNIHHDDDLDSLRGDPRFEELLDGVRERMNEERKEKERYKELQKKEQYEKQKATQQARKTANWL